MKKNEHDRATLQTRALRRQRLPTSLPRDWFATHARVEREDEAEIEIHTENWSWDLAAVAE
jgi:hypothetical protein